MSHDDSFHLVGRVEKTLSAKVVEIVGVELLGERDCGDVPRRPLTALVSTDKQDLACASGGDVKGFHCGFESQGKRWTKSDPADEKKTLRPYSTTTGINFLAAGVWSDPALSGELPKTRFAVTCKLNVAGKMPRADVRWHEGEGWNSVNDWYTGDVSVCKLSSIQK